MRTSIIIAAGAALLSAPVAVSADVDGHNLTGKFANAPWVTYQSVDDDWGGNNVMALYVNTNATHLLVGIPAYVDNNCVVLFIDGNPGTGSNVIPAGLTQPERVKGMAGMSFDPAFTPDRAISLGLNTGGSQGYPHKENIVGDATTYMGLLNNPRGTGGVVTNGNTILAAYMPLPYTISQNDTAPDGIEMAIAYEDIANSSPTVKLMAIVANLGGDYANNQSLPTSGGDSNAVSGQSSAHHYDLVPGLQYLTVVLPTADTNVQFYASATKSKGTVFAGSTPLDLASSASGGTPPYSNLWNLGNGFTTNAAAFSYTYPAGALTAATFAITAIISDSGGLSITSSVNGPIKVYPATFVDGLNIPADFAGKTNALQDTASNWGIAATPGGGSELDRLYAYSQADKLYLGVCGNIITGVPEVTLGLFIDSDYAVGSNVLPLVTAGGKLQNLQGLTFDQDFTPDKALVLSVNAPGDCWVNLYHINEVSNDWYWGTKTEYASIFNPFQRIVNDRNGEAGDIVAFNDLNAVLTPQAATNGLECCLDYNSLIDGGLLMGDKVKIQAILFYHARATNNVANQSLPGIHGDAAGYGDASNVNYNTVSGLQYIEVGAPVPEPVLLGIVALLGMALRRNA